MFLTDSVNPFLSHKPAAHPSVPAQPVHTVAQHKAKGLRAASRKTPGRPPAGPCSPPTNAGDTHQSVPPGGACLYTFMIDTKRVFMCASMASGPPSEP